MPRGRPKGSKTKNKKELVWDIKISDVPIPDMPILGFPYKAILIVMGKKYEAEGTTLKEVIETLKPDIFKTLGILTIFHGENKKEHILTRVTMQNLFGEVSSLRKDAAIKNVCDFFVDM